MAETGNNSGSSKGGDGTSRNIRKLRSRYHINTNIDFRLSPTLKRVVFLLFAVLFIIVTVHQIYLRVKPQTQLNTQSAVIRRIYASTDVPAFVIRRETVLPASGGTTVVPCVENGAKVSIGDPVADIYVSESAASSAARLKTLDEQLEYYKGIEEVESANLMSDIEIYNSAILDSLIALKKNMLSGDLSELRSESYRFSESLTKRQIVVGKSVDVTAEIAALEAETEKIKSSSGIKSTITADRAGSFVNTVDGYEAAASYEDAKKITYDGVEALLNAQPVTSDMTKVGKIITSFVWYVVCIIPEKDAEKTALSEDMTVSVDGYGGGDMKLRVVAKNTNTNGYVTLVLMGNELNEELASLRKINIRIHTEDYTGYEIDKRALRTVDGDVGVYVQLGNVVRFKKVDIVYSDDSLVLSAKKEGANGYVTLYDEVIIEGTDLYDGKVID